MDNIWKSNINKYNSTCVLKCNCVPSGMCHSSTLSGCPHKHYFNENNEWICDINKSNNHNYSKSKYTIIFYNNNGHLMIKFYDLIPDQIRKFAYKKIKNKINYATDNKNLKCYFFILKNSFNNTWEVCLPEQTNSLCEVYTFNDMIITLDYSQLDIFDPKTMILS